MTSHVLQDAIKAHGDFFVANKEQFQLFLPLWRLLTEGKPVEPVRLALVAHRSLEELQALLQSSEVEVDQQGRFVGFSLSLVPTPHQFHLGEQTFYTWCALDTLALPALLGRTAHVVSTCPATGTPIRLTVTPTHIERLEPASAVVSSRNPVTEDFCHARANSCVEGHFFVSREVASAWPSLHPQANLFSVEEAAQLGREMARQVKALQQEPDGHNQYSI
jgi:alkylmercury lyase